MKRSATGSHWARALPTGDLPNPMGPLEMLKRKARACGQRHPLVAIVLAIIAAILFALLGSSCAASTASGPTPKENPYRVLLQGLTGPSEPALLHHTTSRPSQKQPQKTQGAAAGTAESSPR